MLKSMISSTSQRIFTCLFVPSVSRLRQSFREPSWLCTNSAARCPDSVPVAAHFHSTSKYFQETDGMTGSSNLDEVISSSDIHLPEENARFGFPNENTPRMIVGDEFYKDLHIVYIAAVKSNIIMTLAKSNGETITTASSGSQGLKNKKESTNEAAQLVAMAIFKKAESLNIKNVRVCLKGISAGRSSGVKSLHFYGMNIVSISDNTELPFGGNRPGVIRRK